MSWTEADVQRNRAFFAEKLSAMKERAAVLKAVQADDMEFVLLDTRGRDPFAAGHVPGAWCVPLTELESLLPQIPKDREIVTFCWGHD